MLPTRIYGAVLAIASLLSACLQPPASGALPQSGGPDRRPETGNRRQAITEKTPDSLRLTVHLRDGSNITGIPSASSISIRTPYRRFDLPFADLSSVAFLRNSDTVIIRFRNGDRLQGVLNGPLCRVQTLLGSISPSAKDLASLTIAISPSIEEGSLLAWYPFDGNANDESGHNNNGVVNGAVPTEDRFGIPDRAFRFDGLNAHIAIPSSPTLHPRDQLSIALWIRVDAESGNWSPIIHKGGTEAIDYSNREYSLFLKANEGSPLLYFFSAGEGGGQHEVNSQGHAMGVWHFIVCVADRRHNVMQIYADGTLVNQVVDSFSKFRNNESAIIIGSSEERLDDWASFKGALDDVRIYSRALTAQEVSEMFVRR